MLAAAITQGFARFTYAAVLPAMTEDMLGSYAVAGLLGAVSLAAYAVAVLIMTARPPSLDPATVVHVGLVGTCIGLVLITVAPDILVLALGLCLVGACGAATWLPASGIVAATAPPHRRGLAYGLMSTGVGAAIMLSGLLASFVQQTRGETAWREVWAIVTVLAATVTVVVYIGLRPRGTASRVVRRHVRMTHRGVPVARVCLCYGLYGIGFSIFVNYLIAALVDTGMTSVEANRSYSVLGLTSIFSAVLLGRISDWRHRSHTLGATMFVTGCCALGSTLTTDRGALLLLVAVFGLTMTGIGPVLGAYLGDELAVDDVVTVFGAATLAMAAAQVIAPPLGGWMADSTGSFTPAYLVSAFASMAAGIIAWNLPSTRPRSVK